MGGRLGTTLGMASLLWLVGCEEPTLRDDGGWTGPDAHVDDAGSGDAGIDDDGGPWPEDGGVALDDGGPEPGEPDAGPSGPVRYAYGRRHSPIPADVAERLRDVAARAARRDDVFAKVGDSITVSTSFLHCFTGTRVDLDGRPLDATIAHFAEGDAAGTSPFTRASAAAGVGWSASRVLTGSPSPLAQELAALSPRFAVVMYGTNDVGFVEPEAYARQMLTIVDTLLMSGTIPLLSSIPPRDDSAAADARVPLWNGIVRAVAAARGVPFVDYHAELLPLPRHGLASDGVHPQASALGACILTDAGLQGGVNVRNLLTLEALDRARRVVVEGERSLDDDAPRLLGEGTRVAPFVVPSLPFAHAVDTRREGEAMVARWDGCATTNESGPEVRFRFELAAPTRIAAYVLSADGADLDVHIVRAGGGASDCVARNDRALEVDLEPGSWELVADTYASSAGPQAGEGLVVILPL